MKILRHAMTYLNSSYIMLLTKHLQDIFLKLWRRLEFSSGAFIASETVLQGPIDPT